MRPTPAELISHVRRILRDVVEPELDSAYAKARLAEIRATLAQVEWDDAGLQLARDVTTLRELLSRCRQWIESDEVRKAHFADNLALMASLPHGAIEDFAAGNGTRVRYHEVVIALIDPLEDWLSTGQDDGTGLRLRGELLSTVVR
ncbi:hypothetical protein HFP15_29750 [Amycolatopsis sp. K13G38]|uniref:Uncharacterized protein n=1 Tax=Amycolatopsis acididurans TaxID=2724524 RepID=A0ABX1JB94_9PSEU|nr:hypothetical protein [Amycolatopsis acididurans]NKQ57062.1 hypothetical protein [Amycolatopsis acididurans]